MQNDCIGTSPFCSIRQYVSMIRERNYLVFIWFWLLWDFDWSVYHRSDTLYHRDPSSQAPGYMGSEMPWFLVDDTTPSVCIVSAGGFCQPLLFLICCGFLTQSADPRAESGLATRWLSRGSGKGMDAWHCGDVPVLSLVILHHNFTTKFWSINTDNERRNTKFWKGCDMLPTAEKKLNFWRDPGSKDLGNASWMVLLSRYKAQCSKYGRTSSATDQSQLSK